jgi:hypothetical protein
MAKKMKKLFSSVAFAIIGLGATAAIAAPTNLVTNGGFETLTHGSGKFANTGTATSAGTTVATGWTSGGYNFVYTPGTADSMNAATRGEAIPLWGPANGAANGLTTSPTGGNFFAADGVYQAGPLQQTISNLVVGKYYILSFDFAGAQQYAFDGPTTEGWQVSLGGDTRTTQMLSDASHGFTGWYSASFSFVATSATEVLSFLALGTPNGQPPISLLDNVTLNVPEPGTLWALAIGGLALLLIARKRRRDNA